MSTGEVSHMCMKEGMLVSWLPAFVAQPTTSLLCNPTQPFMVCRGGIMSVMVIFWRWHGDLTFLFRDIQELQKQNQQLRSALRELSAEQEKAESHEEGGVATEALKRELENTRQEVEHLKQSRLKQEELVQSIIKQKDMYKRLVEQGEFKEVIVALCNLWYYNMVPQDT